MSFSDNDSQEAFVIVTIVVKNDLAYKTRRKKKLTEIALHDIITCFKLFTLAIQCFSGKLWEVLYER